MYVPYGAIDRMPCKRIGSGRCHPDDFPCHFGRCRWIQLSCDCFCIKYDRAPVVYITQTALSFCRYDGKAVQRFGFRLGAWLTNAAMYSAARSCL